jgi:RNA polymerase sigma-70 factor (ECF subfamily)
MTPVYPAGNEEEPGSGDSDQELAQRTFEQTDGQSAWRSTSANATRITHDMTSEQSDLALVQLAQRGDAGAFDALVRRYQHKIVKLVLRYVRDPAEAEDIAQEAFIKAYRALPRFRGDSAFYTWLYRIAINTAKNVLAARGRNPISYDIEQDSDEGPGLESQMKDMATPEALAMTDEIRSTVNQAIDQLPEDLRTAIVLRELEGLSYDEIAQAMSCPVGTVRSRIFRAREAIDARLREVFEGGLGRGEVVG